VQLEERELQVQISQLNVNGLREDEKNLFAFAWNLN